MPIKSSLTHINCMQVSINTPIPIDSITDLEILMLNAHGFQCKKDTEQLYIFAENPLIDHVEQYKNIRLADAGAALKSGKNGMYFDENMELVNPGSYHCIFQNIIGRTPSLPFIEIQGAYIGSGTKAGEYTWFAELVTSSDVMSIDSGQNLSNMHERLRTQKFPINEAADAVSQMDLVSMSVEARYSICQF